MKEVKNETIEYRQCKITYIINENDDGKFTAQAGIKVPEKPTLDKMEILPDAFETIEEAQEKIMSVAKKWVDDVEFVEGFNPHPPR